MNRHILKLLSMAGVGRCAFSVLFGLALRKASQFGLALRHWGWLALRPGFLLPSSRAPSQPVAHLYQNRVLVLHLILLRFILLSFFEASGRGRSQSESTMSETGSLRHLQSATRFVSMSGRHYARL
jgi:hypothetical protein